MDRFLGLFQIAALTIFLALVAGRAVWLRWTAGINVFTLASGKRGLPWLVEVAGVPILLAWITAVVLSSLGARSVFLPPPFDFALIKAGPFRVVGAVLIVLAIGVFIAALVSFGKSWRVGIDERNPGRLVRDGIFAVSRNPIFVALDLYFLGTFLINGTVVFLLFAALVVAGVHYQILQEERFLRQRYGPEYEAYCRATNRYLGRAKVPGAADVGHCVAPKSRPAP